MKSGAEKEEAVPCGWTKCKLPEFCYLEMGQSPPSDTYNSDGIGLPFYQGKSEFGDLYPNPEKYCSAPNKIAKKGDILLSIRAPVGPTNLSPHEACIGRGLAAIRPPDSVQSKFLLFLFRSLEKRIEGEGTGTTFKAITKDFLVNLELKIPPLAEQYRIVEKIEELFSDLDDGIASLKRAQQQLKVYRQAVLKWAFEGKLTAQWREEQQRQGKLESAETLLAQIKAERERRYQAELAQWQADVAAWEANGKAGKKPRKPGKPKELLPLTPEETQELPELPQQWLLARLGYLTLGVEYGTSAKSDKEGKIPVLRMGNIQNCRFDWNDLVFTSDEEEIAKYRLQKGDVLFNRTNSPELVGKTAVYQGERPAIFAGYLIRINHLSNLIDSKYINYFLNSIFARNHGNKVKTDGVNQSNINGQKLMDYPLPYTGINEQLQIVEEIESRLSICDSLEATITENLERAEALRQSILKRAFEGKLVPQDPNDEPASVLLERIRASKSPPGRG
ncbi:restriction endonuclease [Thermoleptolyngbya oregonensis NK1-22]|uniref:Restriction endonuclease n=1 Tax=Thermoleptolyngbya oregonensis NK1-22 TaxID=2547457 RepID=A0AA97BE80_9CYAN|nr:restriction endonuclease [Thermoleptolyngbya oregonensis NK1-22]